MELINIDGVNIPFDKHWDICVSVSGGADSALLAYILSTLCNKDQTIYIINHIRCWKTKPWQQHDFNQVFDYLKNKFPHLNYKLYQNFISPELEYGNIGPTLTDEYGKQVSGDNIEQRSFAEYICTTNKVNCYYNSVTQNPPIDITGQMKERSITKSLNNSHLEYMEHMGFIASHPFRFTNKAWVMNQYIKRDIQDLLDITRSCEGISDIDYTNYKPGQYVPVCNNCFWCQEREWAITNAK